MAKSIWTSNYHTQIWALKSFDAKLGSTLHTFIYEAVALRFAYSETKRPKHVLA